MSKTNLSKQPYVTLLRRFGAIFYDSMLLFSVLIFSTLLATILFNVNREHPLFFIFQSYIFIISFIFYAWSWTHSGQTLGMKTWKFKITNLDDQPVTWKESFVRFTAALLSWLCLGLGFLWSLFDNKNRTWHDIVSNTKLTRV